MLGLPAIHRSTPWPAPRPRRGRGGGSGRCGGPTALRATRAPPGGRRAKRAPGWGFSKHRAAGQRPAGWLQLPQHQRENGHPLASSDASAPRGRRRRPRVYKKTHGEGRAFELSVSTRVDVVALAVSFALLRRLVDSSSLVHQCSACDPWITTAPPSAPSVSEQCSVSVPRFLHSTPPRQHEGHHRRVRRRGLCERSVRRSRPQAEARRGERGGADVPLQAQGVGALHAQEQAAHQAGGDPARHRLHLRPAVRPGGAPQRGGPHHHRPAHRADGQVAQRPAPPAPGSAGRAQHHRPRQHLRRPGAELDHDAHPPTREGDLIRQPAGVVLSHRSSLSPRHHHHHHFHRYHRHRGGQRRRRGRTSRGAGRART